MKAQNEKRTTPFPISPAFSPVPRLKRRDTGTSGGRFFPRRPPCAPSRNRRPARVFNLSPRTILRHGFVPLCTLAPSLCLLSRSCRPARALSLSSPAAMADAKRPKRLDGDERKDMLSNATKAGAPFRLLLPFHFFFPFPCAALGAFAVCLFEHMALSLAAPGPLARFFPTRPSSLSFALPSFFFLSCPLLPAVRRSLSSALCLSSVAASLLSVAQGSYAPRMSTDYRPTLPQLLYPSILQSVALVSSGCVSRRTPPLSPSAAAPRPGLRLRPLPLFPPPAPSSPLPPPAPFPPVSASGPFLSASYAARNALQ